MLCFALAAWIRSCQGTDEAGGVMPMSDPQLHGWSGLPGAGLPVADTVRAYLGLTSVFGLGLADYLAPVLETALADIRGIGVLAAAQMRLAAQS
jgi:fructuronate reductase